MPLPRPRRCRIDAREAVPSKYDQYTTHHQSRRWDDWDYTQSAAYFVTICVRNRQCLYGQVEAGRMSLNRYGRVAAEEWRRTEDLRDQVDIDVFVVMPNHVHAIVVILPEGDAGPEIPRSDTARRVAPSSSKNDGSGGDREFGCPQAGSLGTIVGAYKSAVTRRINQHRGTDGESIWQGNYHDHVIRTDDEWRRIRRYIRRNPARWHRDRLRDVADP